jgi:hypothetical protein
LGVVSGPSFEIELLPGAGRLLAAHSDALPQRDDLCGALCGALALRAALIDSHDGEPIDQDAVALAAGSVVAALPAAGHLPRGERSRRDYRLALPFIDDADSSGTTAAGLVRAVELLSGGALAAIPYEGPWSTEALAGMFDHLRTSERPVTLVANLATRHLWGSTASVAQMLGYLLEGAQDGPPPDWDVGHFVCVIGRIRGPSGSLYGVADTYPSLGSRGVHVQPGERLARALQRPQMAAGGLLVIAASEQAPAVRAIAAELGLSERAWDNGTILPEALV